MPLEQALSGIKVLDVTHHTSGPYCTKLLACLGAEVIKIEKPEGGDPARRIGPFFKDEPHPEKSGLFLYLNTGKKSVTLNLKSETGVNIFKELLKDADIVVENFEPRVMPALGLSYNVLEKINPGVIMTSISNFGQTGPYRDYEASSFTVYAMSGGMYQTGEKQPIKLGGSQPEYMGGLAGFISITGALYWRASAQAGQHVDVSVLECLIGNLEGATSEYAYMGVVRQRKFSRIIYGYPVGIFPCKDGHVVVIPGLGGMSSLALLLEKPELEKHPVFADRHYRMMHPDELDAFMVPWLMEHEKREIEERAQELRMPFSAVLTTEELIEDPHLKAREFFSEIDHPVVGKLNYPGAPFRMSETPWQAERAPLLGEHNEEIYQDRLGYSREDVVKLRESGII